MRSDSRYSSWMQVTSVTISATIACQQCQQQRHGWPTAVAFSPFDQSGGQSQSLAPASFRTRHLAGIGLMIHARPGAARRAASECAVRPRRCGRSSAACAAARSKEIAMSPASRQIAAGTTVRRWRDSCREISVQRPQFRVVRDQAGDGFARAASRRVRSLQNWRSSRSPHLGDVERMETAAVCRRVTWGRPSSDRGTRELDRLRG